MQRIILFLSLAISLAGCATVDPCLTDTAPKLDSSGTRFNLGQCWTKDDRLRFYTTGQGSLLVPYRLVMPLEFVDPGPPPSFTTKPFFERTRIEDRWRFLALDSTDWDEQSDVNKQDIADGWPVGFTVDKRTSGKWQGEWLGLTCAACHTAQIEYKGAKLRIAGGPTMADVNLFLQDLQRSLAATVEDGTKGGPHYGRYKDEYKKRFGQVPADLLQQLEGALHERNTWHAMNDTPIPAGYGRLDAFGDIFNAVLRLLGLPPVNRARPNAPVSYPFLWDTSYHDWTQWNGYSPAIPIGRNVGQVLGVFAKVDPECGFFLSLVHWCEPTSTRIDNQKQIQELVDKLRSPKWPDHLPPINSKMVPPGESLFKKHCAHCHGEQRREEPLKGNDMAMVDADDIGTDPTMVQNTDRRKAIQPDKRVIRAQDRVGEVLQDVLMKSALGTALKEWAWSCFIGKLNCSFSRQERFEAYKGRPLDGIWATAPYLHNGSVPNLFYLLKPPKDRPTGFCVGSREIDPVRVGFQNMKEPDCKRAGLFWLDTAEEGNSNAGHHGHEYGGDFTNPEIEQLVEYMKTL